MELIMIQRRTIPDMTQERQEKIKQMFEKLCAAPEDVRNTAISAGLAVAKSLNKKRKREPIRTEICICQ